MIRRLVEWNRQGARFLERRFQRVFGTEGSKIQLERRIRRELEERRPEVVVEVGGIDRPLLARGAGFEYVGVDIESQPECFRVYDRFIVQSIEQPLEVGADMLISITLLEHVPDNRAAVKAMFGALKPGGTTHHYIPSKWHPYAIALRLVGPQVQKRLIPLLRPHAVALTGYPAFFDNCTPAAMTRLFREQGFEILEVKPFYRASDYFAFLIPAYLAVVAFENFCAARDLRLFASGFIISARRPLPPTSAAMPLDGAPA